MRFYGSKNMQTCANKIYLLDISVLLNFGEEDVNYTQLNDKIHQRQADVQT